MLLSGISNAVAAGRQEICIDFGKVHSALMATDQACHDAIEVPEVEIVIMRQLSLYDM